MQKKKNTLQQKKSPALYKAQLIVLLLHISKKNTLNYSCAYSLLGEGIYERSVGWGATQITHLYID